jgi:hypothetical protein
MELVKQCSVLIIMHKAIQLIRQQEGETINHVSLSYCIILNTESDTFWCSVSFLMNRTIDLMFKHVFIREEKNFLSV